MNMRLFSVAVLVQTVDDFSSRSVLSDRQIVLDHRNSPLSRGVVRRRGKKSERGKRHAQQSRSVDGRLTKKLRSLSLQAPQDVRFSSGHVSASSDGVGNRIDQQ